MVHETTFHFMNRCTVLRCSNEHEKKSFPETFWLENSYVLERASAKNIKQKVLKQTAKLEQQCLNKHNYAQTSMNLLEWAA